MATRLSMVRGDTFSFNVTITDSTNLAVSLVGKTLIFTLKKALSDSDANAVAQKRSPSSGITITNASQGKATVTISPADTRTLTDVWQALVWDLQMVDGTNVYTVASGTMTVSPDVTVSTS